MDPRDSMHGLLIDRQLRRCNALQGPRKKLCSLCTRANEAVRKKHAQRKEKKIFVLMQKKSDVLMCVLEWTFCPFTWRHTKRIVFFLRQFLLYSGDGNGPASCNDGGPSPLPVTRPRPSRARHFFKEINAMLWHAFCANGSTLSLSSARRAKNTAI